MPESSADRPAAPSGGGSASTPGGPQGVAPAGRRAPGGGERRTAGPGVARRRGLSFIGVLGELLITAGVLVLVFLVWQLWWTDVESDQRQNASVHELTSDFGDSPGGSSPAAPKLTHAPSNAPRVSVGKVFAIVRIPRFGAAYARPLIEGTRSAQLDKGIGHSPGTAMPGQIGNFATAGHRVTYGKPYNQIHTLVPGDKIIVETKQGWSIYRYVRHRIVTPNQVEVLAPVPDQPGKRPTQAWMTMVACHPPFSARQRYVGYALLEEYIPRPGSSGTAAASAAGAGRATTSAPTGAPTSTQGR